MSWQTAFLISGASLGFFCLSVCLYLVRLTRVVNEMQRMLAIHQSVFDGEVAEWVKINGVRTYRDNGQKSARAEAKEPEPHVFESGDLVQVSFANDKDVRYLAKLVRFELTDKGTTVILELDSNTVRTYLVKDVTLNPVAKVSLLERLVNSLVDLRADERGPI